MSTKFKKGFSLIEIMVAIGILSIVLVTAAQAVAKAIQNYSVEEHKIYATFFAEELVNWVSVIRESNWSDFTAKASSGGTEYCVNRVIINTDTLDSVLNSANCGSNPLGIVPNGAVAIPTTVPRIYNRTIRLVSVGTPPTRVNALVTVSWQEYGQTFEVPLRTSFTIHE